MQQRRSLLFLSSIAAAIAVFLHPGSFLNRGLSLFLCGLLASVGVCPANWSSYTPDSAIAQTPHTIGGQGEGFDYGCAGELQPGDRLLEDGSLYDICEFNGRAGQSITITLESNDFDTFLAIIDPQGNQLASNDDKDEENTNSELTITLPTDGTYQLLINAYDDQGSGAYFLNASSATGSSEAPEVVITQINDAIDSIARGLGTNNEQLRLNAGNLKIEEEILASALFALDDPKNPNSLKAVMAGTAPILQGQPIAPARIQSAIQNSGFLNYIEGYANTLTSRRSPSLPRAIAGKQALKSSLKSPAFMAASARECHNLLTPEDLRKAMIRSEKARLWRETDTKQAQILRDIFGLLGGGAVAPFVAVIYAFDLANKFIEQSYPSPQSIRNLKLNIPETLNVGSSASWSASIEAETTGFTLNTTDVLDGVLTFGGLSTSTSANLILIKHEVLSPYPGSISFPACSYTIDIAGDPYSALSVQEGRNTIAIDREQLQIQAQQSGLAQLQLRPNEEFWQTTIFAQRIPLILGIVSPTETIRVEAGRGDSAPIAIAPTDAILEPNQVKNFQIVNRNLSPQTFNAGFRLSATGGEVAGSFSDAGGIAYTAPAEPGTYTIRAVNVADPSVSAAVTVKVIGTGDVRVTLRWATIDDLDLAVTDPMRNMVSYGEPKVASGGQLDVDSNAGCDSTTTNPAENIFWPNSAAPSGNYVAEVTFFAVCRSSEQAVPFTIVFEVNGERRELTGTLSGENDRQNFPFSFP